MAREHRSALSTEVVLDASVGPLRGLAAGLVGGNSGGCHAIALLAGGSPSITETTTGATWPTIRRELDRLHLGTFTGPTGLFQQVTTLTKPQTDLLAKLAIPAPKQIITLEPTPR